MTKNVACCFLAILFVSCAASIPYSSDYPLTQESFRSRDGILNGRVPQGWFSSTDDTLGSALTAWFIRDDLSASLSLKELKLDRLTSQRVTSEGLKLLAHLSALFHVTQNAIPEIKPEEFEMQGKKYCAYECGLDRDKCRIVVFAAGGKYYECEARAVKGTWSTNDFNSIFSVQQTLLASLSF